VQIHFLEGKWSKIATNNRRLFWSLHSVLLNYVANRLQYGHWHTLLTDNRYRQGFLQKGKSRGCRYPSTRGRRVKVFGVIR
jgi:hypothetical protein